MPVIALVTPGPEVTSATPIFSVERDLFVARREKRLLVCAAFDCG